MAESVVVLAFLFAVYTYAGYPLTLWLLARIRGARAVPSDPPAEWPSVSITVPAYNEAHQIAATVESLLALDYPADRKQMVIVSDASDDGTDEIVEGYADRGVQLVRQPERRGKTAAEEAVAPLLTGEIVVNTDASIRIRPDALKKIVMPFQDPEIGLASGRDVSVAVGEEDNEGESGYVGYEMWIRDLETAVEGIVGASGSFYAIRRELHHLPLPEALSRDFAAALNTRERGFRSVSVSSAAAVVPRAKSLRYEYRRKVRTITRGMETLLYKRGLLNPLRHGLFAWMLASHKVCRWTLPWVGLAGYAALGVLTAEGTAWAAALFGAASVGLLLGIVGWAASGDRPLPRVLSLPAFGLMGNVAALKAGIAALRGTRNPTWEPTRRTS